MFLLIKNATPTFLKGQRIFSHQIHPVEVVKNPKNSQFAQAARNGSETLKQAQKDKNRKQAQDQFWKDSATALGTKNDSNRQIQESLQSQSVEDVENLNSEIFQATSKLKYANHLQKSNDSSKKQKKIQKTRQKLPISQSKAKILQFLRQHPVIIIVGETGSGKTTQLSQYLYEAGYGGTESNPKTIICTQPRRVAAVSVAKRVAEEQNVKLGGLVGYTIRFEDISSSQTRIRYVTEGVLLRERITNPSFSNYSVVIIDEAHERSLNTDLLLGLLKMQLRNGSTLKVIITSATLESSKFAKFFQNAPILKIPGRTFPVSTLWNKDPVEDYVSEAVQKAINIHLESDPGDILIFMTGQADVETTCLLLAQQIAKIRQDALDYAQALENSAQYALKNTAGHLSAETTDEELIHSAGVDVSTLSEIHKELDSSEKSDLPPTSNKQTDQLVDQSMTSAQSAAQSADQTTSLSNHSTVQSRAQEKTRKVFLNLKEKYTRVKTVKPLLILPIYSNLPSDLQAAIFKKTSGSRKCIVATNIAETSLTLDGVKYVIDPGFQKTKVYNPKIGMDSLIVVPISQANARQRAGRAGRTSPGIVYRLYTQTQYSTELLVAPIPEIQRSSLTQVILLLKTIGIHDLLKFEFIDAPPHENILSSLYSLWMMKCLKDNGSLSLLGSGVARYPIEPNLGKLLVLAPIYDCEPEILSIVSMLSVGNIFYRPKQRQEEADNAIGKFMHPLSDHLTLLNAFTQAKRHGFNSLWCKDNFIDKKTIQKVRDLRGQLMDLVRSSNKANQDKIAKEVGIVHNLPHSVDTRIRMCLAWTFYHNASKAESLTAYSNLRTSLKCFIHPSSTLSGLGEPPEYVIYHELIYTSREYMRHVTTVDPEWLCQSAPEFFQMPNKSRSVFHRENGSKSDPNDTFEKPSQNMETSSSTTSARVKRNKWSFDFHQPIEQQQPNQPSLENDSSSDEDLGFT